MEKLKCPPSKWSERIEITPAALLYETIRLKNAWQRRYGVWVWFWVGSLVCVLLAGSYWWRQHLELKKLNRQLAQIEKSARRSLSNSPLIDESNSERNHAVDRLGAFTQSLLPQEDIPATLQDILALAQKQGLTIQRGDYRLQTDPGGSFIRYRMNLPVQGEASAIYRFIDSALQQQKMLALESVQFKRDRILVNVIEAQTRWTLFAQDSP